MADKKPSMVVVAGPNGSGKTTLTETLLKHQWAEGYVYINADEIAERQFGGWNSPAAIQRATLVAGRLQQQCIKDRQDFAYETVLASPRHIDLIRSLKAQDWAVRLFFVGIADPEVNIRRIAIRFGEGGHTIPDDRVRERYHRSMTNLKAALPLVDRAYIYDNSVDGVSMVGWVRLRGGEIVRVTPGAIPEWIEDAVTAPQKS
jgi:predicted ABC-type ATPase